MNAELGGNLVDRQFAPDRCQRHLGFEAGTEFRASGSHFSPLKLWDTTHFTTLFTVQFLGSISLDPPFKEIRPVSRCFLTTNTLRGINEPIGWICLI